MTSDTDNILSQIKSTITLWSEGSLSFEKAKQAYAKLHDQYLKLERKYISENARGFIKGILHHHNIANNAALTALLAVRGESVEPLVFAGDALLMKGITSKITIAGREEDRVSQIRLGEKEGKAFTLFYKSTVIGRDTIVTASVASTPLFSNGDFLLLTELLSILYSKKIESLAPVMLNYVNDISTELSKLFNGGKDGPVYTDHFILYNQPGAFSGVGIHNLIDFSRFIVNILKQTYPSNVHIFTLSLSNYFVLYDEKTKMGLDIRRNRIDFDYHGNSIPYKVNHTEIGTQQQLYLFLESL